jgi:hypothetical protein
MGMGERGKGEREWSPSFCLAPQQSLLSCLSLSAIPTERKDKKDPKEGQREAKGRIKGGQREAK